MKTSPKKTSKTSETKLRIKPLGDRILVKESLVGKEKMTASGIIIPLSSEDKGGKRGQVMAVGEGRMEEGKNIPLIVEVGDEVIFQWGDKIVIDNEEYFIVKEPEILAIIN